MKKITKIEENTSKQERHKELRAAAYCRVSTNSVRQAESLEAQISHYETYVSIHPDLSFVGVYADRGITGTKMEKRPELMRLIADCSAGKIDLILTKSISRFARNTADCLDLVRKLLDLGVPVFFEKENLNTGSMESELFLSILSSLAADESFSISENGKWSIRNRFENGTFKISYPPYGYDWDGEQMRVNPKQASHVKEIFKAVLSGKSCSAIADTLNGRGIPTKRSGHWSAAAICRMLGNEKYVGDCVFQKTFSDSSFNHRVNRGEKTRYALKNHHEAIVDRKDFEAARALINQRAQEKGVVKGTDLYRKRYVFSGRIICGECGGTFKRRIHDYGGSTYAAWCCRVHLRDKNRCSMLFVREDSLKRGFATMMNKLIFSHRAILKPYLESLMVSSADGPLLRIRELQTLLSQNTEKREALTRLLARGIIDPVLYGRETNELLSEADDCRKEIRTLKSAVSSDASKAAAAAELLRFAEKAAMQDDFDEELFEKHVKRVTVINRAEFRFELKCGLCLTERI